MKRDPSDLAVYQNTYEALERLLFNSIIRQKADGAWKKYSSEIALLKEDCTIKLYGPRRSGHSTALVKLAYTYFNRAMFLAPTNTGAQNLQRCMANLATFEEIDKATNGETELYDGSCYMFRSFAQQNAFTDNLRGYEYEALLVDCACFLKPKTIESLYKVCGPSLSKSSQKFFIFMQ